MKKLLIAHSKGHTGVVHHRVIAPHVYLTDNHSDFKIDRTILNNDELIDLPLEKLEPYDAIIMQRLISTQGKTKEICDRLRAAGIKIIFDVDDYWVLSSTHPYYEKYREHNIPQQVIDAITNSDLVITTNENLFQRCYKYNKNVHIIPNTLNPNEPQWKYRNIESGMLRVGYIGGSFHWNDIKQYEKAFQEVRSREDLQIVYGGHNPENIECTYLEKVFTSNYKKITSDYKYYLDKNTNVQEHITYDKPYRRLHHRDVMNYGYMYDDVDVSLALLYNDAFNRCKSNLKILEAGMKKKAIICSDVETYTQDKECKAIKYATPETLGATIKNYSKQEAIDNGEELHEYININYNIDSVTKYRKDVYTDLLK